MAEPLKVLFFDIETTPMISYHWRTRREFIAPGQILHDSHMLTWAAKWRGSNKVMSDRLSVKEVLKKDDTRIVGSLADLIREADISIAHNVNFFDLPVVQTRLAVLQMDPLDLPQVYDTLNMARQFKFSTNNLDNIARQLGVGRKIKTDFELWKECVEGSERALKKMERYNRQDVNLLEDVFERLLPYARNVPRLVDAVREREDACPFCGHEKTWVRGYYRAPVNTYQKRQCQNCKKYFRHFSMMPLKRLRYNTA